VTVELFFPPGHLERKRNADKLCIMSKYERYSLKDLSEEKKENVNILLKGL
jgi:hypothetical protein